MHSYTRSSGSVFLQTRRHADTHAPTPHPDVCACGHGMSTSRHEGTTSLKTRSRRTILASIRRTQRRWMTCWRRSRSTRPGSSILSEQVGIWSWLQQLAILNTRAFGDLSCRKQHIVMRFYFLEKVLLYNRLRETIRSFFYILKKKNAKKKLDFNIQYRSASKIVLLIALPVKRSF